MNKNTPVIVLLILSVIWSSSLFLAPMSVENGTVHLSDNGKANSVDYSEIWNTMPLYPRIIYYIGDFNCHQMGSRSYFINGNQMPVCSRDVGVFIGMSIGFLTAFFTDTSSGVCRAIISIFPKRIRSKILSRINSRILAAIIISVFIFPMIVDGFLQLTTAYESTNPTRTLTGFLFGWILALFFGSFIASSVEEIHTFQAKIYKS
ncbi:MAG: DUF2085 domain-containing protein [Thermoplasmatales archaeon]|nr:DUF2085 domain-containing protein [Thermoplasmatales archaeon]